MNRLYSKVFLVLLISGLTACSHNYPRSSLEPNALIPFSVGNTWNYTEVNGHETASAEVLKSETRKGSTWFLYKEFGYLYWVKNDANSQIEAINAFGNENLPKKLGEEIVFYSPDKAMFQYSSGNRGIQYNRCGKEIVVPAGSFPCHVYTVDLGDGKSSVNYYAQGVGLIRNEFDTEDGTVVFELSSYQVE